MSISLITLLGIALISKLIKRKVANPARAACGCPGAHGDIPAQVYMNQGADDCVEVLCLPTKCTHFCLCLRVSCRAQPSYISPYNMTLDNDRHTCCLMNKPHRCVRKYIKQLYYVMICSLFSTLPRYLSLCALFLSPIVSLIPALFLSHWSCIGSVDDIDYISYNSP